MVASHMRFERRTRLFFGGGGEWEGEGKGKEEGVDSLEKKLAIFWEVCKDCKIDGGPIKRVHGVDIVWVLL